MNRTLADWLDYQQRVHPRAIELGLDRVRAVWQRLGAPRPAPIVITVGGTNGKGSTVALLEAMLAADGRRVGAYTSPHLLRYNERVRIHGEDVQDQALVEAFEHVDAARDGTALTYFEFGTLAALWLFARAQLDAAILEVGLGGRLDAVNIVDADAAIVTTVDLDHQDWLGDDRESIGREKAGIFRHGRPAIVAEARPPASLLAAASVAGADLHRAGFAYSFDIARDGWRWHGGATALDLPLPALAAPSRFANAAGAIAALHALRDRLGWNPSAIAEGVVRAQPRARLQRFAGRPDIVVDVAHNPQAARELAQWLAATRSVGHTFAVFGALDDKDVRGIAATLHAHVDRWHLVALDQDSPRGLSAPALRDRVVPPLAANACSTHADVATALDAACAAAGAGDRVIAFGSFHIAGPALEYATRRAIEPAGADPATPPRKV